ncbi:MAG: hypothetical protein V3R37_07340 [Rhodospirillales bacterium]
MVEMTARGISAILIGALIVLLTPFINGGLAEARAQVQVEAGACPARAAPPAALAAIVQQSKLRTLRPYSISQTVAHYYDAPLGLGILEVGGNGRDHAYDWMFKLELPLWGGPDRARPLGWLIGGALHTAPGAPSAPALTGAGMVETGYELTSFIVWEIEKDWFKIKLAKGLSAWTHRCHLRAAKIQLDYVSWPTFLRRHGDWLHFRKPLTHMLRAAADIKSRRVTTIGLNHKLVLLDIDGDWMKVEVEQPDITCMGGRGGVQPLRHIGWVKWRDDIGPWVYFYTRGC